MAVALCSRLGTKEKKALVLIKLGCTLFILNTGLDTRVPLTPSCLNLPTPFCHLEVQEKKTKHKSCQHEYLSCEWLCPHSARNALQAHTNPAQTLLAVTGGLIVALRWSKVRENDGHGASGEGPSLRGDQWSVIRSGVYFLPASANPPSIASTSLGSILGFHKVSGGKTRESVCAHRAKGIQLRSAFEERGRCGSWAICIMTT